MSTLTVGLTATVPDLDGSDPDTEVLGTLTLTDNVKVVDQTVTVAASTPTTSTVVWQATKSDGTTQHGVSGAAAAFVAMVVTVDQDKTLTADTAVGLRALYTNAAGSVLTDVAFQQRTRATPVVFPASVRDSSDAEHFLTRIEARNRNTTAVPVQAAAWK
jgi:hypothetical protein